VKAWAFGQAVAGLAIVGGVVFLFLRMDAFTVVFVGLIRTFVTLTTSQEPAIKSMVGFIPASVVTTIQQQESLAPYLSFFVMGPGLVAAVVLLSTSVVPCMKKNKGSYCCTKVLVSIAYFFLVLSFGVYAVFAAFAVIITYPPVPLIDVQINQITGICATMPGFLRQITTDNQAVIDELANAGEDVTTYQTELVTITNLTQTVVAGCGYIDGLFDELFFLFVPGVICICGVLIAFFTNTTLCCATGCCFMGPKVSERSDVQTSDAYAYADRTVQTV
jgi:hypothetical protein